MFSDLELLIIRDALITAKTQYDSEENGWLYVVAYDELVKIIDEELGLEDE